MTRKDYIIIASALLSAKVDLEEYKEDADGFSEDTLKEKRLTWRNTCHSIAVELSKDNMAFNAGKFLRACGA